MCTYVYVCVQQNHHHNSEQAIPISNVSFIANKSTWQQILFNLLTNYNEVRGVNLCQGRSWGWYPISNTPPPIPSRLTVWHRREQVTPRSRQSPEGKTSPQPWGASYSFSWLTHWQEAHQASVNGMEWIMVRHSKGPPCVPFTFQLATRWKLLRDMWCQTLLWGRAGSMKPWLLGLWASACRTACSTEVGAQCSLNAGYHPTNWVTSSTLILLSQSQTMFRKETLFS